MEGAENGVQYLGRGVCATYKGRKVRGKVISSRVVNGVRRWDVMFDDDYHLRYGEKRLRSLLVPVQKRYAEKQIDYIFVSNSHVSSRVTTSFDARTLYTPGAWSEREHLTVTRPACTSTTFSQSLYNIYHELQTTRRK